MPSLPSWRPGKVLKINAQGRGKGSEAKRCRAFGRKPTEHPNILRARGRGTGKLKTGGRDIRHDVKANLCATYVGI